MERSKTTSDQKYGIIAVAIACVAMSTPSYSQYLMSPIATQIMEKLHISNSQFASLFSAPMRPAIFLSLIAGILIDKLGAKRMVAIAMCIAAAGAVFRIASNTYGSLMICMAMTGVSACFLTTGATKILGMWFPPERIGSMMGILMASNTLGMTIAVGTTAMLPSMQSAFVLSAVVSVAAAILWILGMKDPKKKDPKKNVEEELSGEQGLSIRLCLKEVLKSKQIWIISIALFFIIGAHVTINSFIPTALANRGIDSVTAGLMSSCITFGCLLGCFITPALISRTGKISWVLMGAALLAAIMAVFGWQAPQGILLIVTLLTLGIAMGGLVPALLALPIQLPEIGPAYSGTAGGILVTIELMGAVIVPSYVITPIAKNDFTILFSLAGVSLAIAGLLMLFLRGLNKGGK